VHSGSSGRGKPVRGPVKPQQSRSVGPAHGRKLSPQRPGRHTFGDVGSASPQRMRGGSGAARRASADTLASGWCTRRRRAKILRSASGELPRDQSKILRAGVNVMSADFTRRHFLGSTGIAFFAGGSIGTATALVLTTLARWFGYERGALALEVQSGDLVPAVLLASGLISYGVLCLVMARGMMGLHRAPVWKAMAAAGFAMAITAFLFGSVLPEGSFGWRPFFQIGIDGGYTVHFGFRG
jgi:hypothetical protein